MYRGGGWIPNPRRILTMGGEYPPLPVVIQTPMKTLPSRNFVKNNSSISSILETFHIPIKHTNLTPCFSVQHHAFFHGGLSQMLKTIYRFDIYRPQRSCDKVMFLRLSVILSTGGGVWQTPPLADITPPGTDILSGRYTPARAGTLPPRDGHCSGRYASYGNAFLFIIILRVIWSRQIKWNKKAQVSKKFYQVANAFMKGIIISLKLNTMLFKSVFTSYTLATLLKLKLHLHYRFNISVACSVLSSCVIN